MTSHVQGRYLLYCPDHAAGKLPLLLFLHGAGERGDNLERVKVHGPLSEVEQGRTFPFMIVAPQCPEGQVWDDMVLSALLDDVQEKFSVDEDQIWVTGLSMGGYGTWALAACQPNRFAAIVPICGGANPVTAPLLSHLPIWVRHGDADEAIPVSESRLMVERLRYFGAKNVRYDEIAGGDHNVWSDLYASTELYDWLMLQRRR